MTMSPAELGTFIDFHISDERLIRAFFPRGLDSDGSPVFVDYAGLSGIANGTTTCADRCPCNLQGLLSRFLRAWAIGSLCLLLSGCGEDRSKLVPVSGVVTRDGKPLVGALVEFEPVPGMAGDPSFNPSSTGTTDEEGRFTLDTPFGSGAVVGRHFVKIWAAVRIESEEELAPGEEMELRLLPDFGDSGWQFTVSEQGTEGANFALQSSPTATTQAGSRQRAADPHGSPQLPTRGYPVLSDRTGLSVSRTLWCGITILLWILSLVGCFKWWKHNERLLHEQA